MRSAGAIYLDRPRRIEELRDAARRLATRRPEVQRVILYGSLARGTATPRSDADLLVVVRESVHGSLRDRIPEILLALSPLPCPVDLHVLTVAEFDQGVEERNPLVREAREGGIALI